jgi:hypothetical protein
MLPLVVLLLHTTRVIAGCLTGEFVTDVDACEVAVFGVRFIIKSFDV